MSWLRFCSLSVERDVDHAVAARRLVDLLRLLVLLVDLLEVAELVQTADAVLQRLGVEHRALDQPHLAPDHVVARRRVADEGDAVDEVLLAFLQPHRHVDGGRLPGFRHGEQRVGHRRVRRRRWKLEVGKAGELHVAAGAVDFARLDQAVADVLLVVPVADLDLEERRQRLALDDGVAVDREGADAMPLPFGDRNAQLDPLRLAVLGSPRGP